MLTPSIIKSRLMDIIDDLEKNIHLFVKSPGKNLTRHRSLPFKDCIKLLLSFENHTLQKEIDHFFKYTGNTLPSSSAFVQQRNKFNEKLLPHLFYAFNKAIPFSSVRNGLHLLACDGSDINLPKLANDTIYLVKYKKNSRIKGYWQMHINTLFNIVEQRFVDAVLQPRPEMSESAALCEMVDRCPSDHKALFTADRGYPSFNLFAHIIEHHHYFLMRTCNIYAPNSSLKHLDLPKSGEFDREISITLTRSRKKMYSAHPEKYRCLHSGKRFDYIPEHNTEATYTLAFRVVAVEISKGNMEFLLTNLPYEEYPVSELKKLYGMRWNVELAYRSLKYALSLSTLHSVKREFIIQEVYAKLTMYNFTSLLARSAEKKLPSQKRKHKWDYKVSFSNAASVAQHLLNTHVNNKTILKLLLRAPSAVHPGKQNPRVMQTQSVRPLNNRG